MVHASMADVPVGAASSNEHIVTAVTKEVCAKAEAGVRRYWGCPAVLPAAAAVVTAVNKPKGVCGGHPDSISTIPRVADSGGRKGSGGDAANMRIH